MPTEREVQHPDGRIERITETSAAPTTVVERRSGSGMDAVVAPIVGLSAVLVISYFLMNMNRSDAVKGNAADNIGEAARDAVPERK